MPFRGQNEPNSLKHNWELSLTARLLEEEGLSRVSRSLGGTGRNERWRREGEDQQPANREKDLQSG